MYQGALYVATGQEYVDEAVKSARTLKNHNDIDVGLIADREPDDDLFNYVDVHPDRGGGFADKIELMAESPFKRTVYLDTDIYVTGNLEGLFDLLDRFDIGAKHKSGFYPTGPGYDIPYSFPEFNTGVVVFRASDEMDAFFETWASEFDSYAEEGGNDQPAFRKALYESDLRLTALTDEFHCRFIYPGAITGKARLFHGRHDNIEQIASEVNETNLPRVFVPTDDAPGISVHARDSAVNQVMSPSHYFPPRKHFRWGVAAYKRRLKARVKTVLESLTRQS